MRRIFRVVFALSFLLAGACQGAVETYHYDGVLSVTVAMDAEGLQVVGLREATEEEPVEVEGEGVAWVFEPADGSASLAGEIADARVLRSEFDEDGNPAPELVLAPTGLFEVRVPAVKGTLGLWASDGSPLGEVELDPSAPVTRRSELLRQGDVMGGAAKIVDHGSASSKVDILFLPEGYRESEMGQFRRHVESITRGLAGRDGYRQYWNRYNVWRQDVKSRSSGTGSSGRPRDTAFETASGISGVSRCVFFANSRGQAAAQSIGDQIGAEVVVVLVNRTQTGACARDGIIVTSRPGHVVETVAHELGHALFGLMDEYDTPRAGGICSTGPNVSSSARSLPWGDMVNTSRLPTPSNASRGTIGAFEGAGYCARGRYRPTHDCLMRTLGRDFCPVCEREVARKMSRYSGGSSGSSGGPSSSGGSSSTPSAPGGLSPNGTNVGSEEVRLTWNRVSGASSYRVTVQRQSGSSWASFGTAEASGTAARVTVRSEGGRYRWKVEACSSDGCSSSQYASFSYGASSGSSSSGSTSSGASGSLSVPSNLQPARSSVVSDATPSLSWSGVSGASHYGFKMIWHDGSAWREYVRPQDVTSTRVSTTLNTAEKWYGFAVRACSSSGCSDWSDFSTLYYRP